AKEYFQSQTEALNEIKSILKNANDPLKAIASLQDENNTLKKQVETLSREKAKNLKGDLKSQLEDINNVKFLAAKVDLDVSGIKDLAFDLGSEMNNLFALFATEHEGKATLTCYISKELVSERNYNAGKVV